MTKRVVRLEAQLPRSDLQLILFDSAVEGLTAALYAVLELSVPLRKLTHDRVWTGRSLPRWIALAEVHRVPGKKAMPGPFFIG